MVCFVYGVATSLLVVLSIFPLRGQSRSHIKKTMPSSVLWRDHCPGDEKGTLLSFLEGPKVGDRDLPLT